MTLLTFNEALHWAEGASSSGKPILLLGNGFSVAQNVDRFSYRALLEAARMEGLIGGRAEQFFEALATVDFELVIQHLLSARTALRILDAARFAPEIAELEAEAGLLKEALARTLASLHPERPGEISDAAYRRVRAFLAHFRRVYTANYDLLLYWSVMQDGAGEEFTLDLNDDGFRDGDHDAPYVVWDYLDAHTQSIYYLHGALHVYRDIENAELRKLTWVRTGEPLIDQIRGQLAANRFPLIVTEGTSKAKLSKIQSSDYLAHALRSLKQANGGVIAYGLSFSLNDEHIMKAIVQSTVKRLAVSLYGDPANRANVAIVNTVSALVERRRARPGSRTDLDVEFFDAGSVELWADVGGGGRNDSN